MNMRPRIIWAVLFTAVIFVGCSHHKRYEGKDYQPARSGPVQPGPQHPVDPPPEDH